MRAPLPLPHTPVPVPGQPAGRRASARVRLGLPARLELLTGTFTCRLDDISQSGAKIAMAANLPPVGASAVLMINGIEGFGEVVWQRGQFLGMQFDEPLPLASVVALRQLRDDFDRRVEESQRRDAEEFVRGRRNML